MLLVDRSFQVQNLETLWYYFVVLCQRYPSHMVPTRSNIQSVLKIEICSDF